MRGRVEAYARQLKQSTVDSVRSASALKVDSRRAALQRFFSDPENARTQAAQVKTHVLANLKALLLEFEEKAMANGIHVHWAEDRAEANSIILELCERHAGENRTIVKAKSMITEELHLNDHLSEAGFVPIETDLGEFVVQIDGDTPSHIVTPIIHKTRQDVARSFDRENLGPYTEIPEELALQARDHLRLKFREASIGISGVNFAIASTGRIVLVENEGNNRYSATAPDTHIAVMGIEKILPNEACLALFLPLLASSATGQQLTTYTHLINGPRAEDEADGPRNVHIVLVDNGRTKVLAGDYREILSCIRCGACLNVCPVYRQSSGHAYGHVYSGPVGAVLAPALDGIAAHPDLPKASTLCGSCEEVCPVKIRIPHLLLKLRNEAVEARVTDDPVPWTAFKYAAIHPKMWRAGLTILPMAAKLPHPLKSQWKEFRDLPSPQTMAFRRWWNGRS